MASELIPGADGTDKPPGGRVNLPDGGDADGDRQVLFRHRLTSAASPED